MPPAECSPAAGKFPSPFSGCGAPRGRASHSSPVSLSAPHLTPVSETDAQIPDEDKGKTFVSFTAKRHRKLAIEVARRHAFCFLFLLFRLKKHERKFKAREQNSGKKKSLHSD